MWADSMAGLAGCWCHHAAADTHLQALLQELEPMQVLSSKQMADINTCYTTLLVSMQAQMLYLVYMCCLNRR